ncbi:hypothetical protein HNO88_002854 [Novosphingobium chloroacetimidivorans]|uniref:Uncharacterized protein n=1 Tax=Novosphingobium chloroacetimidivorans TaxID=1428314 RepID=A0A7W7KB26_9SPHN|nr:hypothetical protein [Novosphingobium chloroacetimidivorans]MBB4859525.1 hypothetical protein [Novosphingobium chloroacetimidivorans]
MTKVVVRKFGRLNTGQSGTVTQKRVWDAGSGQFTTVRTIDAQSKTLSEDLNYVFSKNVAKARRENKAVAGVLDRAPTKP